MKIQPHTIDKFQGAYDWLESAPNGEMPYTQVTSDITHIKWRAAVRDSS